MLAILSGTGPPAFFAEAATVIVAGAVVAYVGSRLGPVTIVGFLVAGIVIGLAVQRLFPLLISKYFPQAPGIALDWVPAAQGLSIGLLTTLLFTLPTLLRVRRIKPVLIFRREMAESKPT